jgi:predicted enzyme related to lactoylglutathione lyase
MGNRIVHFEINAPGSEALHSFYAELFGWDVRVIPGAGYGLVDTKAGSGINGGIGSVADGSTFVTFYVEADDLQAVLDRAVELGGTVATPETEIQYVTYAMIADPDGLLVGVVKTGGGGDEGHGPSSGDGCAVDWIEVLGKDAAATQRFYTELFDWKLQESGPPGYALLDAERSGSDVGGGLGAGDGTTWVTVYASVPDIEAAFTRAEALGAEKLYGPNDVGQNTLTGAIKDPAGNAFGLYSHRHPHD